MQVYPLRGKKLYGNGILGCDNPKSLLCAVFTSMVKFFCLHGGSEHRNLKLSQLQWFSNPQQYVYTENGSKETYNKML